MSVEAAAPLRIGMIGAGQVSRFHLEGWRRADAARVVAICNRTPERAHALAAAYGIERVYTDIEAMLDGERLDAVDITVAPELHRPACLAAAERGVAILCQKPLAGSLAAAQALTAELAGCVPFMVHENWRFRPHYRRIRQWVAQGDIGTIRRFHFSASGSGLVNEDGQASPPLLRRQPFLAGMRRMITLELLVHHLDTIGMLCRPPLRVESATMERRSAQVIGEDYACIQLVGADGVAGTVIGDWCVPGLPYGIHDRLELDGTQGRIRFADGVATLTLGGQELGGQERSEHFDPAEGYQASYSNIIDHFAACLRTGRPFESTVADNLRALELVEAAYAASGWPAN
ncbi:MAG: Gfo/Idh/MocA family protein [Xanthobacteraceae bacterium]